MTPVIIGANLTISESFTKYLNNITGKFVKGLQETAILATAHVVRRILM